MIRRMMSMMLAALISYFVAPPVTAAPTHLSPRGIFHFDAEGNTLSAGKTANTNSEIGDSPFPYATSCSCNLTDSCSVQCNWNERAECSPYSWNGGLYCQCYCY